MIEVIVFIGIVAVVAWATTRKPVAKPTVPPVVLPVVPQTAEQQAAEIISQPTPLKANIGVSNLVITTPVIVNRLIKISFDLHNYSNFSGSREVTLVVGGRPCGPRAPILNPGEVKTELYGLSIETPGTYQVLADGLAGTLTVIAG